MKTAIFLVAAALTVASVRGQNTAKFPGAVPGHSDLFVAKNRAQTTLTGAISSTSATTINVTSSGDFDDTGLITIDNEIIAVCAKTGTTFTVGRSSCPNVDGRGFDGTIAATHSNGAVVQARMTAWHHNQVAAEAIAIATKLNYELVSVRDYGAVADGVTDDRAAIQSALNAASGKCIYFPGGTYIISSFLNLKASNSCLLGGPSVRIENTYPGFDGYQNDGIRIGTASALDGDTGTEINISDVYVSGFNFINGSTRMGIWAVYARRVTIENIQGDGKAVIAVGNDADDECEHVIIRNITRTGVSATDWYTAGIFNTQYFVLDGVLSPYAVTGGNAIAVGRGAYGTITNVVADQNDNPGAPCITLEDSNRIQVSNFVLRNCSSGVTAYFGNVSYIDSYHLIGPGMIESSDRALNIYTRQNTITGVKTFGNTTSLVINSDAQSNYAIGNTFIEGTITDTVPLAGSWKWQANIGLFENYYAANVGIGQTSPEYPLVVASGTQARAALRGGVSSASPTEQGQFFFGANVRGGTEANKIIAMISGVSLDNTATTAGYLAFAPRNLSNNLPYSVYMREWGGLTLAGNLAIPTCNSSTRGTIFGTSGGAGVKDTLQVCAKDSGDAYAWRTIY